MSTAELREIVMKHSFDTEIARHYGVDVAIFLDNLAFWILKNQANKKHFHNGRYWTYNSQEALCVLFPYYSRQQLRTVISTAVKKGLIIKGNYNKRKNDKTTWYALTDMGLSLFPELKKLSTGDGENQPSHWLESTKPLVGINQALPDSDTDIKTTVRKKLIDNFYPNAENQKRADKVAQQCGTTGVWLIRRFIKLTLESGRVEKDLDKLFARFLDLQKPFKKNRK